MAAVTSRHPARVDAARKLSTAHVHPLTGHDLVERHPKRWQERAGRTATEDSMDREAGLITHPKFRMWLRPDGIVQLVWAPRATMALEDALAATEAMSGLTGGRPCPLLVDTHDAGLQDRPARIEFARRADLVSAVALIIGTPLSRLMGNFFLSVSRPMAPTRLFDDEASAVAWLKSFTG